MLGKGDDWHETRAEDGLTDETVADLDAYRWPSPDWFRYDDIRERCRAVKARGIPSVGGEGGCGIQHVINLRGYSQALLDPLEDPRGSWTTPRWRT